MILTIFKVISWQPVKFILLHCCTQEHCHLLNWLKHNMCDDGADRLDAGIDCTIHAHRMHKWRSHDALYTILKEILCHAFFC